VASSPVIRLPKSILDFCVIISRYVAEGDVISLSKVAGMTYLLIAVNIAVFFIAVYGQSVSEIDALFNEYGLTPIEIMQGENLVSLVTSMFLHADLLHLAMNMLFLFIAGDGVEREMGGGRFLMFYLVCGVLAGFFHVYMNQASDIPCIGASGAIFGVLAAFAVLFPFRWLVTLLGFIPVPVPAIILVFLMISAETVYAASGGVENIAHTAHIGGFLAGVFLTLLFGPKKRIPKETKDKDLDAQLQSDV